MKFKMADIVRLTQYLVCTSRTLLRHTPRDENNNFQKLQMADGSHFENSFITISQPRIIRFQ